MLRHELDSLYDGDRFLLPHPGYRIHLVTHRWARAAVDHPAFASVTTCDLDHDLPQVLDDVVTTTGASRIVSMHEKCLLEVARARERHGLAGTPLAAVVRFRDKLAMKAAVERAGVMAIPQVAVPDARGALPAGRWVMKPRFGLGAERTRVLPDGPTADVRALHPPDDPDVEYERYVVGALHHCDSLVHDGRVVFSSVSRYVGAPIDFRTSPLLGSVQLGRGGTADLDLVPENRAVLECLGLRDGASHLEYFVTPAGDRVFCEVACRPGGGGIDRVVRHGSGLGLIEQFYRLEFGEAPSAITLRGGRRSDAHLAFVAYYPGHRPPAEYGRGVTLVERIGGHSFGDASERPRHAADFDVIDVLRAADEASLVAAVDEVWGRRAG